MKMRLVTYDLPGQEYGYLTVIYKFLNLGFRSVARSGQAKLKIAKPSHQRGKQSKASNVTWWVE
jgi:hypothetical protein